MTWLERAPWLLLAVALAAGGYLRLAGIDQGDLYGDAAEYALIAQNLREHPFDLSYSLDGDGRTTFVSQPHLVLYAMAAMDVLLGPSDVTARITVATFGILGILGAFLLGREAHTPLTGAGAALFVAILPVHVDLSRSALLEVPLATGVTFACWLALRAVRTSRVRDAVWAGVGVGLAALTKLPGILVGAAIVVFLAAQALRERARYASWTPPAEAGATVLRAVAGRAGAKRLAVAAGAAAAVLGAYLLFLVAVGAWDAWTTKMAWQASRMVGDGETDPWTVYFTGPHGLPTRMGPGLWWLGVLGVVGTAAAWAVGRPRPSPGDAVVLAAVATFLGFFLASDRKIWFYVVPVAPLLVVAGARVVVAAGMWAGRLRLPVRDAQATRHARTGVVVAIAALVALQTVLPSYALAADEARSRESDTYGANYDEVCDWLREERHGDEGVFSGLLSRYAVRYYCPEVPVLSRFRDAKEVFAVVAQREVRWLVTDPYYTDDREEAFMAMLLGTFPHETVATFGGVEVVEFRPQNLTVQLALPEWTFARGHGVPLAVVFANPAEAPVRDLSGSRLEWVVYGHDKQGWAFRIHNETTHLGDGWTLGPGVARALAWEWSGRSYWSNDTSPGRFYVEVAVAGEVARTEVFHRR